MAKICKQFNTNNAIDNLKDPEKPKKSEDSAKPNCNKRTDKPKNFRKPNKSRTTVNLKDPKISHNENASDESENAETPHSNKANDNPKNPGIPLTKNSTERIKNLARLHHKNAADKPESAEIPLNKNATGNFGILLKKNVTGKPKDVEVPQNNNTVAKPKDLKKHKKTEDSAKPTTNKRIDKPKNIKKDPEIAHNKNATDDSENGKIPLNTNATDNPETFKMPFNKSIIDAEIPENNDAADKPGIADNNASPVSPSGSRLSGSSIDLMWTGHRKQRRNAICFNDVEDFIRSLNLTTTAADETRGCSKRSLQRHMKCMSRGKSASTAPETYKRSLPCPDYHMQLRKRICTAAECESRCAGNSKVLSAPAVTKRLFTVAVQQGDQAVDKTQAVAAPVEQAVAGVEAADVPMKSATAKKRAAKRGKWSAYVRASADGPTTRSFTLHAQLNAALSSAMSDEPQQQSRVKERGRPDKLKRQKPQRSDSKGKSLQLKKFKWEQALMKGQKLKKF